MRCLDSFARPAAQVFRWSLLLPQAISDIQKLSPSILNFCPAKEGRRQRNCVQPASVSVNVHKSEHFASSLKGILSKRGLSLASTQDHRSGSLSKIQARASSSVGAVSMAEGSGRAQATEYVVVYVTISNNEEGRKLAKSIVEAKLAACVNMVPGVESTYWWEGKVTTDSEVLLIIKTRQSLLGDLTAFVKANHPYELPEVISLPITGGNDKYLEWLGQSTERKGSE